MSKVSDLKWAKEGETEECLTSEIHSESYYIEVKHSNVGTETEK